MRQIMPSATATTVPKFAATPAPSGSAATKSGVPAGVSEPVKNLHLVQMMAIDEEGCGSINPEITDQHRTQTMARAIKLRRSKFCILEDSVLFEMLKT